jgi:hypothetical protein
VTFKFVLTNASLALEDVERLFLEGFGVGAKPSGRGWTAEASGGWTFQLSPVAPQTYELSVDVDETHRLHKNSFRFFCAPMRFPSLVRSACRQFGLAVKRLPDH